MAFAVDKDQKRMVGVVLVELYLLVSQLCQSKLHLLLFSSLARKLPILQMSEQPGRKPVFYKLSECLPLLHLSLLSSPRHVF